MSGARGTLTLEVISGPEGLCVALNNRRIAGPKPWGGGRVLHSFRVSKDELLRAVPELATRAQEPRHAD